MSPFQFQNIMLHATNSNKCQDGKQKKSVAKT